MVVKDGDGDAVGLTSDIFTVLDTREISTRMPVTAVSADMRDFPLR